MIKSKTIFFPIIYLLSYSLFSQGGFRSRQYLPPAKNNVTKDIFEISPGNYLACGISVDTLNGVSTNKLTMMQLGSQGEVLGVKKYGNKQLEYLNNSFTARAFYKAGNFVYTACCMRDSNNKQLGALIKFDFNGDTIWQKIYRDSVEDIIPQMVASSFDGGFLITGFFQNWITNESPCLLIKTDALGNEIWRKRINKTGHNVSDGKAIVQDSASGKIVIVGYQYVGSPSSFSMKDNVLILDSTGNTIVRRTFSGFGGNLFDVIQTKDKNFVAVGQAFKSQMIGSSETQKSFIVKIDINSTTTTPPIWGNINFDALAINNAFSCLRELPNGDLIVGGVIDSLSQLPRNMDMRVVRFSPSGSVKSKTYYNYKINSENSDNNQVLTSLNLTSNGGWVASIVQTYFPSPNPLFYVKYDSTGCDSSLYYCQTVGLNENLNGSQNLGIYPNPANEEFFIPGMSNYSGSYSIHIFNSLGNLILNEKNLKLEEGQLKLNISKVPKGIYFLRLFYENHLVGSSRVIKN
ncbi:MAG: T9SS type A sorting domain-containing protein [Bacteroidia bacterium]|nr:T9SS type A sorting domain-containing protein [Bacteroidia bacterium]